MTQFEDRSGAQLAICHTHRFPVVPVYSIGCDISAGITVHEYPAQVPKLRHQHGSNVIPARSAKKSIDPSVPRRYPTNHKPPRCARRVGRVPNNGEQNGERQSDATAPHQPGQ